MRLIYFAPLLTAFPLAVGLADGPPPPHRAPPEAVDACSSKKAGDACSFTIETRSIDGTCEAQPDSDELVCRPARPPGPPPEAIAVCSKAKEGDSCSFAHDGRAIDGHCAKGPDDKAPLACRPSRRPPR